MTNKIVFTTSRDPSPRTRSFLKDIVGLSPYFERLTRGKYTFEELVELARLENARYLIVIGEMRGNPSIMRAYNISSSSPQPIHTYTVFLKGITLSREAGNSKPSPTWGMVLDSPPAENDEDRSLALFFLEVFGASPQTSPSRDPALTIKIKPFWSSKKKNYLIEFYDNPKRRVGPIIRVWGVKKIGSP